MVRIILAFFCLVFAFGLTRVMLGAQVPEVLLKLHLEEGRSIYLKIVTETKKTVKVMDNRVVEKQSQIFIIRWTPEKQEGDNWIIRQKFEDAKLVIDHGQGNVLFINPPLIGSELRISFNTKVRKANEFEGREELLKKWADAEPRMKPLAEQILSEMALAEITESIFAAVPGKEARIESRWKGLSTFCVEPIGKFTGHVNYTYAGRENSLEKIKVETKVTYNESNEEANAGNPGRLFKIKKAEIKSTSGTGTVFFDSIKGRITKSESNLELAGKLSIEIGGQTTEVILNQTQTTTITISDLKP
jgi:hypothetical protein